MIMKPYGLKIGRKHCKDFDCIDPTCKKHADNESRRKKTARQKENKEIKRELQSIVGARKARIR